MTDPAQSSILPFSLEVFVADLRRARPEFPAKVGVSGPAIVAFAEELQKALRAHYASRAEVDPPPRPECIDALIATDLMMVGALLRDGHREARDVA